MTFAEKKIDYGLIPARASNDQGEVRPRAGGR